MIRDFFALQVNLFERGFDAPVASFRIHAIGHRLSRTVAVLTWASRNIAQFDILGRFCFDVSYAAEMVNFHFLEIRLSMASGLVDNKRGRVN